MIAMFHDQVVRRASLIGAQSMRCFAKARSLMSLGAACVALAALLAIAHVPAIAQVIYGSIVGTVTDPMGGAVPGASVKITSLGTNEARTTSTSSAGTSGFIRLTGV